MVKVDTNYIERKLSAELDDIVDSGVFRALQITGPRQSGKTTLMRQQFPNIRYILLEDDTIGVATDDPKGFLAQCKGGAILDEVQRVPSLFSHMLGFLDFELEKGAPLILSGSQNFAMNRRISESLAGRVDILTLLPLGLGEVYGGAPPPLGEVLWRGFYPYVHSSGAQQKAVKRYYDGYIKTYIERDVAEYVSVTNRPDFHDTLRLCARGIGQPINVSAMSRTLNIDPRKVKEWLYILEGSYIIFRVEPYSKNVGRRIAKSPEYYFYDTGLAAHLLKASSPDALGNDTVAMRTLRRYLLENLIAIELKKMIANRNDPFAELFFWRDKQGNEVDFVFDNGRHIVPIEVKSSQTLRVEHFKHIQLWRELHNVEKGVLINCGDEQRQFKNNAVLPWQATDELERLLFAD